MCGGCNLVAESAGLSVIFGRYWWVARQGRKAVLAAESITTEAAELPSPTEAFVDPLPELLRVT